MWRANGEFIELADYLEEVRGNGKGKKDKITTGNSGQLMLTETSFNRFEIDEDIFPDSKVTTRGRKNKHHEPMIGITAVSNSSALTSYVYAIRVAGGLPVIITNAEGLDIVDGVLLPGGNDIDPSLYGQRNYYAVALNQRKDELEIEIATAALEYDIPILGVCRGHQMLAVAAGGTLYQDINSQFRGKYAGRMNHRVGCNNHRVKIAEGTILDNLEKNKAPRLQLNSLHHQSVRRIPQGFKVSARATDGIVEGIQGKDHKFAVGVQYHPEMLLKRNGRFGKLHSYNLFTGFVQACMS